MLTEGIVAALITAAGAVIAQLIIGRSNARSLYARLEKQSALDDERLKGRIDVIRAEIDALSRRVEKHNMVVERMYGLETRMSVAEARIRRDD